MLRWIFGACAVVGAAKILGNLVMRLLPWMFLRKEILNTEAASIGIIGGADGPTAIFVTTHVSDFTYWGLPVMLLVAGIAGWYCLRRNKSE